MKKICKYLLLLMNTSLTAQNLVPNPSFEDTVACPTTLTQIDRATGWSSYSITPDYFNACNNNGQAGVPSNSFGFQNALDGNAYAGFATHSGNLREYIGTQLTQALDSGTKYFISFYVSRGVALYANLAVNKIGIKFSTIAFSNINPQPISNSAQIYTDSIIEDTLSWTKISGSFIADSAYQYLSIGNFFNDSATTFIDYDSTGGTSYYYLDCICISIDSLTCYPNIEDVITEHHKDFSPNIFPNPTSGLIHLTNNSEYPFEIIILSPIGEKILEVFVREKESSVDMTKYSGGIYFVLIKQKGNILLKKIIKY